MADPHFPTKVYGLRRPKSPPPKPPDALVKLAAAAARASLYNVVKQEVDPSDDEQVRDSYTFKVTWGFLLPWVRLLFQTPSWRNSRLLSLKRHLQSVLGEGGPVVRMLYDSIFNVPRELYTQNSAMRFSSPLVEDK